MEKYQKQVIFWVAIALALTTGSFLMVKTDQVVNTATTTNTVTFSGEGKVLAKPDVAIVNLSIVTEGTTSKIAQDENSRKSQAVTDFLKKQDIDEKDIKTTGYNIYPQYTYPRDKKPQISGYQVDQTIQVKVRDLDKADVVLDGIVAAGANQVNNFQLTIDEPEKLQAEAREKAIKDAKEKADKLKKQLGIDLGRIVNFYESSGGYYPMPIYDSKLESSAMGRGGGGPAIPTGENEITINVTITYQIK